MPASAPWLPPSLPSVGGGHNPINRGQIYAPKLTNVSPSLFILSPRMQEVAITVKALGYDPEEVDALFSEADTNKDSLISFEEFVQLMRHSYIS